MHLYLLVLGVLADVSLHVRAESNYQRPDALVEIVPGSDEKVSGKLALYKENHGVYIEGRIHNLSPGLHGFHVHEKGLLGNKCKDAAGHFNPEKKSHGGPTDIHRHVGDLGNIFADFDGIAKISLFDSHISLDPKSQKFVGKRSFVVHAESDDLGRGGNVESQRTGNAGSRVGCGIIIVLGHSMPHNPPIYETGHANQQHNEIYNEGQPFSNTASLYEPRSNHRDHHQGSQILDSKNHGLLTSSSGLGYDSLSSYGHLQHSSTKPSHYGGSGSLNLQGHDSLASSNQGGSFHANSFSHASPSTNSHLFDSSLSGLNSHLFRQDSQFLNVPSSNHHQILNPKSHNPYQQHSQSFLPQSSSTNIQNYLPQSILHSQTFLPQQSSQNQQIFRPQSTYNPFNPHRQSYSGSSPSLSLSQGGSFGGSFGDLFSSPSNLQFASLARNTPLIRVRKNRRSGNKLSRTKKQKKRKQEQKAESRSYHVGSPHFLPHYPSPGIHNPKHSKGHHLSDYGHHHGHHHSYYQFPQPTVHKYGASHHGGHW